MPRPLLVHRYIVREFLPPFGVGLLVFTFVLILHQLFLITDLFLNRGVGLVMIVRMVILILPMFLPLSIPMAALVAALICYGRLSEDNELTALRSSGCSLVQYSLPNLVLAFCFSALLVYFNLNVAPRATLRFKSLYFQVAQKNPLALFAPKIMNDFGEYKVMVDKMDRRKKKISRISIYKMNPVGAPTMILAPEGELKSTPGDGITLSLVNGAIHQPSASKDSEYSITRFNRFAIRIPEKLRVEKREPTPREMVFSELRQKAQAALAQNLSAAPWRTEGHLRIAIAFAPLAFILLGTTLGIQFRRGSKSLGIGISLIVILVYYGLFIFVISLSSQGVFSPLVLTWTPNLLTFLIGGILYRRLALQ